MGLTIEVPSQYGLVLVAASSTFFLNLWHILLTSSARKASGIKYPVAYASKEEADKDKNALLFNCAQRAHANFTEQLTPFLGELLIAGLRWPVPAAAMGLSWTLARTVYATSYARGGPQARVIPSSIAFLLEISLKLMATTAAVTYALQ
ncbi:glutathione S-transferase-like protein [Stachybotrys elegans]|uniref:Glutathione S-transferase-like protein n=1 Tax=Stachybotrys elegans TaxID=80388 RepID=A0A8K0SN59_9HYPO|nr:glutathione S-transferase-like protein [Stachybotrys elegans]